MNTSIVSDQVLGELARSLAAAETSRTPREALTSAVRGLTAVDAYRIQLINIDRRVADGAAIRGHKIGLTARSMQRMFGVDEPDYGHLLDDMFVAEAQEVPMSRFIQPRVEVEPGFILRGRLEGPGVTAADVIYATEYIVPTIEIIDSRVRDWDIRLADTIADNGSSAGVVVGGRPVRLADVDIRNLHAEILIDGEVVETGSTREILGSPVNCVAWLANALGAHGVALEEGHLVLPGTPVRARPVSAGQTVIGRIDQIGEVEVTFR